MTRAAPAGGEDIASHVWRMRYRYGGEQKPDDSFRRVARAIAAVEGDGAALWEEKYLVLMRSGQFLPGGRILAGAGTGRRVTLFNCFVMGAIEDSIEGIFRALQESAITLQQGGGIGLDFSTLRPKGMPAKGTGAIASGPVSFMHVWDRMCATMLSTGTRRGAMMATLRCDHPDIQLFIEAKREAGTLSFFNLSVLVTEAFLAAVREDRDWPLVFPAAGAVRRRVRARGLWERLMRAAHAGSEPGVLFVDRINQSNNLAYCETISATNPCGEVPLPPYGACNLGSLNLTAFVREPFTPGARFDEAALGDAARLAVRMLDTVIDISRFPLPAQQAQSKGSRRIGLGIMGLADALVMLGLRYDSAEARSVAARAMRAVCHAAYRASIVLAEEKGAFPRFEREHYLAAPFIAALPPDIGESIGEHGIRNSHLTAIAPTGTISLIAGQVSSGLEPLLAPAVEREVLQPGGSLRTFRITAHSVRLWRQRSSGLPPAFVCGEDISPESQLAMQAALQLYVDNAMSKTLTVPAVYPFEAFAELYQQADALGLKGCTAFRPGGARGCVARPAS